MDGQTPVGATPSTPPIGWLDRLLVRLVNRPAVRAAVVQIIARDRANFGGDWRLAPQVASAAVQRKLYADTRALYYKFARHDVELKARITDRAESAPASDPPLSSAPSPEASILSQRDRKQLNREAPALQPQGTNHPVRARA